MQDVLRNAFRSAADALAGFRQDAQAMVDLERFARLVVETFHRRGHVLVCGNGGSMADAMHFAEEFTGRFRLDRPAYPVLALSDPAHLTCVANDYGFEQVFSRQVEALGHEGDVLVVLSTSGNSPNVLRAAEAARARAMRVVGLLGKDGGEVRELCDIAIIVDSPDSARVQEIHMLALHAVIEAAEAELGH